ncbi:uncharacterized protein F5891DRAFT_1127555 [Suillus fuscotomentosus]|uniref:Uncharacterized protein n=1 Tax=Suillus fuscotomentosus TaxID=1912939 RepID=A0AAD4HMX9_9AGAM|nr:uncharacterized protein F5891DRAFT_1127555 [Suillus fuscotomentosus]KAG1902578.1 hypothetical protein F5891DRAFT_1127555 [Suillus fuscotomentosus]
MIPCSPISPSVVITIDALELYHIAHFRSPHFSMQAFSKTLCDLHGVEYHHYLSRQLTIAFDVYMLIRSSVDSLVAEALNRDSLDWQLKHACPSCTYTLKDEVPLIFTLLFAMDGNDSLQRILHQTLGIDENDSGESSELPTTQHVRGDRYLSCDYVNQWSKVGIEDSEVTLDSDSSGNPCTEQGHGGYTYDETGIFTAVCRHGFSLLIVDMVQSGELAKYPLAVVAKLMDVFGDGLGGGYDIGCQFKTTLNNSPLGPRARSLHYTSLLNHLARYIPGLGLEDLEMCECTFSKSNSLAPTTHYSSIFHRQQAITSYFKYNDDYEVYANLSDFFYNNYKQALNIIADSCITLPKLMHNLNITHESIFEDWLTEEKTYLQSLRTKPEHEMLQMEYWQKLVNLVASKEDLDATSSVWAVATPVSLTSDEKLERKLSITCRWTPEDPDWQNTGRLALQARSAAIKTALDWSNIAARALSPPCRTLKWEEVVEYAFLANFDLLHDSRDDVSHRPWAMPSVRQATDLYFKTCRAREEIMRLNIEVRCLATYLHDEEHYLHECQCQAEASHPVLAHQINLRRQVRSRFNSHHLQRLQDIANLPEFLGTISPGPSAISQFIVAPEAEEDYEEEEEVSNMEEALEVFDEVLHIATD